MEEDSILELQVSYAVRACFEYHEQAMEEYSTAAILMDKLPMKDSWTSKAAWKWALSSISSRTMYFPGGGTGVLTPFGDLHNHAPPPPPFTLNLLGNCIEFSKHSVSGEGMFDPVTDRYQLSAQQEYQPDQQVYLCYGRHSNLDLLKLYGFVLRQNSHDFAILPFEYFPDKVRQHFSGTEYTISQDGNPSFDLMRALRFASLTSKERSTYAHLVLKDLPVSRSSEHQALGILSASCQEALKGLPSTIDDDLVLLGLLLKKSKLTHMEDGTMMALRWRILYKEILLKAIETCTRALDRPTLTEHSQ